MEPPTFPSRGLNTVRAAPGSDACLQLPAPQGTPPFHYEWCNPRAAAPGDNDTCTVQDRLRSRAQSALDSRALRQACALTMGSNCCKGDASRPLRSSSSIYSRYIWLLLVSLQELHDVPWVLRPYVKCQCLVSAMPVDP
ncbi:unnamed protein product [Chilo suppressalis]|uniref:Spaetzle domain-containing protein n=1 Tax=Chilo suppressalis TaxID=168631 RepID=A0ABN8B202_CHISP|nr:unnamed protein product [Chilo suppressalis]